MDVLQGLQNILLYAASFVIVLSVVVFVHEFGHFQVARWRKVAIDTFSIGFGKTLVSWRDKQGVEWKIGALPLGGYVKFADDADAMSTRSMVVAAGPVTNFIFSILAFAALALIMGRNITDTSVIPARIAVVHEDTAAAAAGLRANDIIRTVNGETVTNFAQLQQRIAASADKPLNLQVERNGQDVA
jgi:regulator of sigma E protease